MKKLLYLITIGFIALSCNSNRKNTDSFENADSNLTASDLERYDCLQKYEEDYTALITKNEFASVYSFPDLAEEDVLNQPVGYGYYTIQWPSERPDMEMTVSGMKIPVPDRNTMSIARLSLISDSRNIEGLKNLFDRGYKELSDEELDQIDKNLEKASDEVSESGKKMMEVRKTRNYHFVDSLGNSAWYRWDEKLGGELAVMAGNRSFLIRIKISDNPDENKEIARKLAEIVLRKCN